MSESKRKKNLKERIQREEMAKNRRKYRRASLYASFFATSTLTIGCIATGNIPLVMVGMIVSAGLGKLSYDVFISL